MEQVTYILGLDCLYDADRQGPAPVGAPSELAAPIFALEAPTEARANQPFSVNAWVSLAHAHDEILPETFRAELDARTNRIVVTGRVRRAAPGTRGTAGPRLQRALVVGIRVSAPAGMYALTIPPTHYRPADGLPLAPDEAPVACAKQWLHVRP